MNDIMNNEINTYYDFLNKIKEYNIITDFKGPVIREENNKYFTDYYIIPKQNLETININVVIQKERSKI